MEKRILIADDEPELLRTVESFLKTRGYIVILAKNGKEAVEKALAQKPHLIILDIVMPDMDGSEAAMLLREDERTKRIPVFFLTGVISPEDQSATQSNPNVVLAKPINFDTLLKAIRRIDSLKD